MIPGGTGIPRLNILARFHALPPTDLSSVACSSGQTYGDDIATALDTRDFMRRVSAHVSIGKAYKDEKPMPAYFALCREP